MRHIDTPVARGRLRQNRRVLVHPATGGVWLRDMSHYESGGDKSSPTTRRIRGPIPEYNRFGEYTGVTYFRCRACGAESLRRIDLRGCCDGA
jgi:hypothetical protein